jgi:hypothetical protein
MHIGSGTPPPLVGRVDTGVVGQDSPGSQFTGAANVTDSLLPRQSPTPSQLAEAHARLYQRLSNEAFEAGAASFGSSADWAAVERAVASEWGMSAQDLAAFTRRPPAYTEHPNVAAGERTVEITVSSARSIDPPPDYSLAPAPGHRTIGPDDEVTPL